MRTGPRIILSSGEMSGDLHAAAVVREILSRMSDVRVSAMAGDLTEAAGAELLFHYRDYAILGFTGVLRNFRKLRALERAMKSAIRAGADLFIAVDYPGLNMRLARWASEHGVPVLYYISPQVWAWGAGRIEKLARSVDRMAVILPFEVDLYRERGVEAEFVGHPFLVDHELPEPVAERSGVGLLPGSRTQEVRRILPTMIGAAEQMKRERPELTFTVGCSPTVDRDEYVRLTSGAGIDIALDDDAVGVMGRSRIVLVASGTATLQTALMGTPAVIVYRVSVLNYLLAKRLIKIPHIGMVNVILGEEVCPEFIQGDATPSRVATAALDLLLDQSARERMLAKFGELRRMLSGGRGAERVAEIAVELISETTAGGAS